MVVKVRVAKVRDLVVRCKPVAAVVRIVAVVLVAATVVVVIATFGVRHFVLYCYR